YGITFNDPIFKGLGFKNGDKVLAVDGVPVEQYTDVLKKLLVVDETVTIERDGKQMDLKMPVDLIGTLVEKRRKADGPMISPRTTVIVMNVDDTTSAYKAGLRKADQIVALDSIPTLFYDEFQAAMLGKKQGS